MTRPLVAGLYELIVTSGLEAALGAIDRRAIHVERRELDPADAHLVLAHHGYEVLVRALVTRGVLPAGEVPRIERPGIPLAASALLVNARDEHRVGHELRRELA